MTSPKEVLDRVVDVVLAYRPPKAPKTKRKGSKNGHRKQAKSRK